MRAIVAYSFGGSVGRPGPSNRAFGKIIDGLADHGEEFVVVVQDAFIERSVTCTPDLVVTEAGPYISTEDVTDTLTPFLKDRHVREVVLVAHPFLHGRKCQRLLFEQGFTVERARTGWVPFDPDCENWWVRNPLNLLLYSVLQATLGRYGR
ncbi:MAG: hypothetical protein JWO84_754 [Parcubacteria group bacterium]|nr:hypothetical protein [Parcubacteria group bacterium]